MGGKDIGCVDVNKKYIYTISQWAAGTFTKIHLMTFAHPHREREPEIKSETQKKRSFKMSKAEKVSLICLKAQLHLSGETDVCREHQN